MKNKSNMSDVEYLIYLRSQHDEMKIDLINYCKVGQKAKPLLQIYQYMEKRYHVKRVDEVGEDLILRGLCRNLISILTACGKLVEIQTGSELAYRTVENADRKVA